VGLYLDPPEVLSWWVVGKAQTQALNRPVASADRAGYPGAPHARLHRQGITSLFAAQELAGGKVRAWFTCHRHVEFIAFLNSLAGRCRGHEIHLICDNYGTPQAAGVVRAGGSSAPSAAFHRGRA
jgi:hypothetical protein